MRWAWPCTSCTSFPFLTFTFARRSCTAWRPCWRRAWRRPRRGWCCSPRMASAPTGAAPPPAPRAPDAPRAGAACARSMADVCAPPLAWRRRAAAQAVRGCRRRRAACALSARGGAAAGVVGCVAHARAHRVAPWARCDAGGHLRGRVGDLAGLAAQPRGVRLGAQPQQLRLGLGQPGHRAHVRRALAAGACVDGEHGHNSLD